MSGVALAAIVVSAALFGQGDDAPNVLEDFDRHQGTWAVERSVRDGKDGPADAIKQIVREVEGDRVVWKRAGEPFAATTFEIDPEADPKTIDVIPEGGPNRGVRAQGIYKFEGDTLVLCTADPGHPRPTTFAADPGSKTTLMSFRRLDAADPPPAEAP